MINHKTLLPTLMVCAMVTLTSGCSTANTEQTGSAFNGNSPIQVALHAMGDTFQDSVTNVYVTQHVNRRGSPDKAVVTIEEAGLLDDSISAERTIFTMAYKENGWEVINRKKTQQCWPGRGHQNSSEKLCQ